MDAAKKSQTSDLLRTFTPLKGLAPERFAELLEKINIHDVAAGRYLFKCGERDGVTIFLIKGVIELLDKDEVEIGTIKAGSKEAADAIAPGQPRTCTARIKKGAATVATIATNLYEIVTSNDSLSGVQVSALDDQTDDDWMTLMLRSPVFQKLPPVNISRLITGMEPVTLRAGDTVFREGDDGDCYYTIKSGRCQVSRRDANGKNHALAELGVGGGFGEDALLSDKKRGATITMLTDGVLMKLAKSAFLQLLNQPLATDTSYKEAVAFITSGAKWLDVRPVDAYRTGHIDGSINIPFAALRDRVAELDARTSYIVCCEDGHASNAAAFFLNQKGFDARVLTGGLKTAPWRTVAEDVPPVASKATARAGTAPDPQDHVPKQTYLKAVEARLHAEKEVLKIKGTLTHIQQTLHEECAARQKAEGEIARLTDELAALAKAQRDTRDGTAATAARIEQQARETTKHLTAELETARADAEQRTAALAAAKAASDELQQQIEALQRQLSAREESATEIAQAHRRELDALNETLQHTTAQLETLTREKNDAATAARRAEAELSDLKRQLETTAKGGEAMATQIRQAEQAKRAAVEDSERLRTENDALRRDMAQHDATHADAAARLEQELAVLRDAIAAKTRDADAARERGIGLEQDLEESHAAAARARRESDAANAELARVRSILSGAEAETTALRAEIGTLNHQITAAADAAQLAARDHDTLQHQFADLRARMESGAADHHKAAKQQDEQRRALEAELHQARSALEQSEQQRRVAEDEIDTLKQSLAAARDGDVQQTSAREAAVRDLESARDQLNKRTQETHEFANRVAELEQQVETSVAARNALNDEIGRLRAQLEQEQASISAAAHAAGGAQQEAAALRDEIGRLQTDRDAVRAQATQVEAELNALKRQLGDSLAHAHDIEESAQRLQQEHDQLAARLADAEHASRERIAQLESDLTTADAARERAANELAARVADSEAQIAAERDQLATRESDAGALIAKIEREAEHRIDKLTREIDDLKKNLQLQTDRANSLAARDKENAKALGKFEKELAQEQKRREKLETAVEKAKQIPDGAVRVAPAPGSLLVKIVMAALLVVASAGSTWFYMSNHLPAAPAPVATSSDNTAAAVPEVQKPDAPAPIRTFRDRLAAGQQGPAMIELPAGKFQMGASQVTQYFDERPQHPVSVRRFSISRHEVTFDEYDAFVAATGRRRPGDAGKGRGDRPVSNVSWHDAVAYAEWLSQQTGQNYRLPSEAEWEYAARAGSTGYFWWGPDEKPVPANCIDCGGKWDRDGAFAVGRYKANAFGLHDTASNVEEWVQDCYHKSYEGAPQDGSARTAPRCEERVTRGGSYLATQDDLRSSKRAHHDPDTRDNRIGFRLARDH